MAYQRVNWQKGTKVSDGYVEIDGTRHTVTPATYSGPTPCNPTSLNIMDVGIEENSNNIDKINNKLNGQASINELYVGGIKHKNFWVFPNEKRITTRESFSIDIPAGTYTISGEITGDDAIDSLIQFYDDNDNLVNSVLLEHNISTHQTFQLSNDCKIVRVYSNDSYESSLNKIAIFENMQLEPGDTVTDYFERKNIIPIIENSLDSDSTVNGASVHAVNTLKPVILYESTMGTSGDVQLNDDVVNYKYLEIYVVTNNTIEISCNKISLDTVVSTLITLVNYEGAIYRYAEYNINENNNKLELQSKYGYYEFISGTSLTNQNYLKVVKVVGYK